jgi:protein-S-isoprenylcysteine O-methyltransferase
MSTTTAPITPSMSSNSPYDLEKHKKTIMIFLVVSTGIGFVSDLSYLYPGIHILKFVGFIIGMALLINVTIIETFVIDNDSCGFGKVLSFNFTTYVFGMIIYYCARNFSGNYFPYLHPLCYFGLATITYWTCEFCFVCYYHTHDLKWGSFLINHSTSYMICMVSCLVEFYIETKYGMWPKNLKNVRIVGLMIMAFGLFLRVGAFISAGRNFTHIIEEYKSPGHRLVTTGLYRICRHPSYLGWYIFTIGGQIVLHNPICLVIFTIVSWKFFYDRIKYEEYTLLSFFGQDYDRYRKRTPIWIPFIDYLIQRGKND